MKPNQPRQIGDQRPLAERLQLRLEIMQELIESNQPDKDILVRLGEIITESLQMINQEPEIIALRSAEPDGLI